VVGARNFCTKLWNATRFALLNGATIAGPLPAELDGTDAWIMSRLNTIITEVDALYERYEFAKITDLLYHFAWDEVCDWYLELSKVRLADEDLAPTTRRVLGEVLDALLRLLHPMIPFVTEALWTALTGGESVVVALWPPADPTRADRGAEAEIVALQSVVNEVRRFRSDQGVKPSQPVPARISGLPAREREVRTLLRLTSPADGFVPTASLTTARGVLVEFDLSGAIDVVAERARLTKDYDAAHKEVAVNSEKLANDAFTGRAPEAIVAKVRDRLAAAQEDIRRLRAALDALPPS
jgi:valyl-tRNA synthetase